MTLGELIDQLERLRPDAVIARGFANPHSYRGYYNCLAFEPAENVTVASMLAACHEADGATYEGWKGGDFHMTRDTTVFLSEEGRSSGKALFGIGTVVLTDGPGAGVIAFDEPYTW